MAGIKVIPTIILAVVLTVQGKKPEITTTTVRPVGMSPMYKAIVMFIHIFAQFVSGICSDLQEVNLPVYLIDRVQVVYV